MFHIKPVEGVGQRVVAERITADKATKGFLEVVAVVALSTPRMAISGVDAVAIKTVEQDILLRQGVVIGGDVLWIDTQVGIAVALGHVPKHLVIGFVFFEDVEHMLEYGRLARVDGDRHRRLAGQGRLLGLLDLAEASVLIHQRGIFAQGIGGRYRDAIGGAEKRRADKGSCRRLPVATAEALDVGRIEIGTVCDHRARIPIGWDKSLHDAVGLLAVGQGNDGDGIVASAGDKQIRAVRAQSQAIGFAAKGQRRGTAEWQRRSGPHQNGFFSDLGLRINHGYRIGVCVGHIECAAILTQRQVRGMQAGGHFGRFQTTRQVHQGDHSTGGYAPAINHDRCPRRGRGQIPVRGKTAAPVRHPGVGPVRREHDVPRGNPNLDILADSSAG